MTITAGEFVKGFRQIELTDGSTVNVRAIRLADLQEAAQSIIGLITADEALAGIDLSSGIGSLTKLLPNLLKLPEFLGGLCSLDDGEPVNPAEWFASRPIEDEFDILEAAVEVSNLERLLPRFFKLVGNLKRAMPTTTKPPFVVPSPA